MSHLEQVIKEYMQEQNIQTWQCLKRELLVAQCWTPVIVKGEELQKENGQTVLSKGTTIQFLDLQNDNGDTYTPVFTNSVLLKQMYPNEEISSWGIKLDDMIFLSKNFAGFVINPGTDNLIINKEFYNAYYLNVSKAFCFKLGKINEYNKPKQLNDFSIKTAPQSYIYLK